MISKDTIFDGNISQLSKEERAIYKKIEDQEDIMILHLIYQKYLGEESYLYSYIKILPKEGEIPSLLTLPDSKIELLSDNAVISQLKFDKQQIPEKAKQLYKATKSLLSLRKSSKNLQNQFFLKDPSG